MSRTLSAVLVCLALPLLVVAAACSDDGSSVRDTTSAASAVTNPSSGSSSGSGIVLTDGATTETDDPLVAQAVTEYKTYVASQVADVLATTKVLTDAIRAGDVPAAKAAYARSRKGWERIEPIASLVPNIDGAIDSRVDDFASPTDPTFTGWHRLEYLLWEKNTTKGAAKYADQLDADLVTLQKGLAKLDIPPAAVAQGASELIDEIAQGKITGEEDRYSKTDLYDLAENLNGAKQVLVVLTPALQKANPELLSRLQQGFAEVYASLAPLRKGDGWLPYCQEDDPYPDKALCPKPTVTQAQVDQLKVQLAGLSEDLSQIRGALGL